MIKCNCLPEAHGTSKRCRSTSVWHHPRSWACNFQLTPATLTTLLSTSRAGLNLPACLAPLRRFCSSCHQSKVFHPRSLFPISQPLAMCPCNCQICLVKNKCRPPLMASLGPVVGYADSILSILPWAPAKIPTVTEDPGLGCNAAQRYVSSM